MGRRGTTVVNVAGRWLMAALIWAANDSAIAQAGFSVGDGTTQPGGSVSIPIAFDSGGGEFVAADLTVTFDGAAFTATPSCVADVGQASHQVGCAVNAATGTVRVLIYPILGVQAPIDSASLGSVEFTANPAAPLGDYGVTVSAISHTSNAGRVTSNCVSFPEPSCAATSGVITLAADEPPVVGDDALTVGQGAALTVAPGMGSLDSGDSSLLANDSDPNGGMLTVTTVPVSGPGFGSLALNADGTFTYTHDGSENFSDGFDYEVCDDGPAGHCANGSVAIAVNPRDADLGVSKTAAEPVVMAGELIVYMITVINNGPGTVSAARVLDPLPTELGQATWECIAANGGACAAGGAGDIDDLVDLAVGASVNYLVTATIDAGFSGVVSNTVTVSVPAGMNDPDPSNNSATDETRTEAVFLDGFEDPLQALRRWLESVLPPPN